MYITLPLYIDRYKCFPPSICTSLMKYKFPHIYILTILCWAWGSADIRKVGFQTKSHFQGCCQSLCWKLCGQSLKPWSFSLFMKAFQVRNYKKTSQLKFQQRSYGNNLKASEGFSSHLNSSNFKAANRKNFPTLMFQRH